MSNRRNAVPNYALQTCHVCRAEYDPFYAEWCTCDRLSRSLICPDCLTCFCDAPAEYRKRYWATSPAAIRHDEQRFGAIPRHLPQRDAQTKFEHPDADAQVA